MGAAERRNAILRVLCRRRHETMENLAAEFGVSVRTIRRDIDVLSIDHPLYTQAGRYMGGVYVVEGYTMERMYMQDEEIDVLKKLFSFVQENPIVLSLVEKQRLQSIISLYSKPKTKEEK